MNINELFGTPGLLIAIAAALVALVLLYCTARARQAAAEAEAVAAKGKALAAAAQGLEDLKRMREICETALAECNRLEKENERLRERVAELEAASHRRTI